MKTNEALYEKGSSLVYASRDGIAITFDRDRGAAILNMSMCGPPFPTALFKDINDRLNAYIGHVINQDTKDNLSGVIDRAIKAYRNKGTTLEFKDSEGKVFAIEWEA